MLIHRTLDSNRIKIIIGKSDNVMRGNE